MTRAGRRFSRLPALSLFCYSSGLPPYRRPQCSMPRLWQLNKVELVFPLSLRLIQRSVCLAIKPIIGSS